ncbi:hypothetical protein EYF80_062275 [Liparis tanakae]|uniref:Uncharacterized protein n=1 Tax=Liparis tanakae TaxID=230148 RepID=A0A4Z2EGB8_9TELE|nr:hypothetical protein EYF80_062275 [Liparis tanakae]
MEDNPIYGNISYIQSSTSLFTGVDTQQSRIEKEDEGNADPVSTMSDLYASVQNQRTKTVSTADNEEGFVKRL